MSAADLLGPIVLVFDEAERLDIIRRAEARAAEDVATAITDLRLSVERAPEWDRAWSSDGQRPRVEPKRAMLAGMLAHLTRGDRS